MVYIVIPLCSKEVVATEFYERQDTNWSDNISMNRITAIHIFRQI